MHDHIKKTQNAFYWLINTVNNPNKFSITSTNISHKDADIESGDSDRNHRITHARQTAIQTSHKIRNNCL